ncbi:MAG: Hsp20 family protein [Candidatus Eisenbacteria bacterium]|nr:Hsp20 family protein [Candidatus Eisenbacteria bacterium]
MLQRARRRPLRKWYDPGEPILRDFDRHFVPWRAEEDEERAHSIGRYPVDMWEEDDSIHVEAEMPGFRKDDVDVVVSGSQLRIRAEREIRGSVGLQYIKERISPTWDRVLNLPSEVDPESATARLEDGVLHVELKTAQRSRKREVKIL